MDKFTWAVPDCRTFPNRRGSPWLEILYSYTSLLSCLYNFLVWNLWSQMLAARIFWYCIMPSHCPDQEQNWTQSEIVFITEQRVGWANKTKSSTWHTHDLLYMLYTIVSLWLWQDGNLELVTDTLDRTFSSLHPCFMSYLRLIVFNNNLQWLKVLVTESKHCGSTRLFLSLNASILYC